MKNIEISPKSVALFTLIPLVIYFLWIVRDLLFSLLIGFILMSALRPAVIFLVSKRIPRSMAVLMVYFTFILFFLYLISLVIPPIIAETTNLMRSLPSIVRNLDPRLREALNIEDVNQYVPTVTNNVIGFVSTLFSNTLFVVSTLFFGLYFLMEEDIIKKFLSKYLDDKKTHHISTVFEKAEKRMSSWFWGELTLMLIVGVLTYIGLNLIGMKYALPLAVLAGLLEVIPNMGPVLSAIPAIIIAWATSYFTGISVVALYFIVQQLENNLIVPMIMRKAVGINPIVTLIALLIGGRIGGVLGVLLSIPLFLFLETIISEYVLHRKNTPKAA